MEIVTAIHSFSEALQAASSLCTLSAHPRSINRKLWSNVGESGPSMYAFVARI